MLQQFREITGYEPMYFYMTFAFICALLISYLFWRTLTGGWQRYSHQEMTEGDLIILLGRVLLLFFFFLWVIIPRA